MTPTTNGSPSRYEPNPVDDRRLAGTPAGSAYLQAAIAIEAITIGEDGIDRETFIALPAALRRDIRRADAALRRLAFGIVLYAPEEASTAETPHVRRA
jgi:hypothetical protein